MNAKQRKKDKKYRLMVANQIIELVEMVVDDLENGKTTISEVKLFLEATKQIFKDCAN